jgi:hypothetical protein
MTRIAKQVVAAQAVDSYRNAARIYIAQDYDTFMTLSVLTVVEAFPNSLKLI